MDPIIVLLAFVYSAQIVDIFIRKIGEIRKRYLILLPMALFLVVYSLSSKNPVILPVAELLVLAFFSRLGRLSDYGISYHFTLVILSGIVFGPLMALIVAFIPVVVVPFLRQDVAVIDIFSEFLIMALFGILTGFFRYTSELLLVYITIIMLIIYTAIRWFLLFTKLDPLKITYTSLVNFGINYYLISKLLLYFVKKITLH